MRYEVESSASAKVSNMWQTSGRTGVDVYHEPAGRLGKLYRCAPFPIRWNTGLEFAFSPVPPPHYNFGNIVQFGVVARSRVMNGLVGEDYDDTSALVTWLDRYGPVCVYAHEIGHGIDWLEGGQTDSARRTSELWGFPNLSLQNPFGLAVRADSFRPIRPGYSDVNSPVIHNTGVLYREIFADSLMLTWLSDETFADEHPHKRRYMLGLLSRIGAL